jgi:tocopherol O-methyltransferase
VIVPRAPLAAHAVDGHYDALDAFYREVWGEHVHHGWFRTGRESVHEATEALARWVLDAAGVGEGTRAVDVGCGYGGTAHLGAARGAVVTGLTLSETQAAVARRRPAAPGGVAPTVLVRDWLANGLPDGAFDAAWAVESTTHMPDRPRVFAEVARVLRPGGRFVLCVWMAGPAPRAWEVRHLLEPICREGRLAGLGTAAENLGWLRAAGLEVEREEDWSRAVARTWTRVARRVTWGLLTDARYRRYLRDASQRDRAFVLTIVRLIVAYRTGAMRYGVFVARRPG